MAASMPGFGPSETKEYLWGAELKEKKKTVRWDGRSDGPLEQIVLKLAVLGPDAVKDERNIVEIVSFNSEQDKIKTCICSLTAGSKENQTLSDLSLFPPVNFTLIQGSGPVHVVANHIILEEDELSDEEDESDEGEIDVFADGKGDAKLSKMKREAEDNDEDDEMEEDEDDDELEMEEEKAANAIKKNLGKGTKRKEEAKVDDENEDEEDDDDEEEEDETPAKKFKLENGKAESKTKSAEKKISKTPVKNDKVEEPKTPKNQKTPDAKTPKSEKKTPRVFTSVDEIKAAIEKYPGGKPKKEDKFCNWVKNTYKVTDTTWVQELWKWHKKAIGF